jgi:hypothetical protein
MFSQCERNFKKSNKKLGLGSHHGNSAQGSYSTLTGVILFEVQCLKSSYFIGDGSGQGQILEVLSHGHQTSNRKIVQLSAKTSNFKQKGRHKPHKGNERYLLG